MASHLPCIYARWSIVNCARTLESIRAHTQTYNVGGSMHLLFSRRRQERKINGKINAAQTAESDCAHTSPFSAPRHPLSHHALHPSGGGGGPTTPAHRHRTQLLRAIRSTSLMMHSRMYITAAEQSRGWKSARMQLCEWLMIVWLASAWCGGERQALCIRDGINIRFLDGKNLI